MKIPQKCSKISTLVFPPPKKAEHVVWFMIFTTCVMMYAFLRHLNVLFLMCQPIFSQIFIHIVYFFFIYRKFGEIRKFLKIIDPSRPNVIIFILLTICWGVFGFLTKSGTLNVVTASMTSARSRPSRQSDDRSTTFLLDFDLSR